MSRYGEKLIQYIAAGYNISSCKRHGRERILKLQPPLLKLLSTSLKLSEADYREAMDALVEHLVTAHASNARIEIQSSHYGQEWVEVRDTMGRRKNKLALSSRTILVLKERLMATTPPVEEQIQLEAKAS